MGKTVNQHQIEIDSLSAWQQAILDSSEYGIISTDIKGVIATFNRTSEILLGYKAEEMIGIQTPAIIHDPDEVKKYAELLSRELGKKIEPGFETFVAITRLGIIDNREWRYVRKDGSTFPVHLSVTAIRGIEQEIIGFLGTFFDLSERKKAEEELDNYRGHLERLVDERTSELKVTQDELTRAAEIAKLGHWRIDEVTNEYLTISVEYARIFGYTVEEFMNRYGDFEKDMELKHPDDKEMAQRAYELREDIELDYRILRRDGEVRYVRESCKYIPDESGDIIESVGTLQDITELKESQLQAEAANLEKSRFLSSISHELRTPMNAVLGFAEVLEYNTKEPLTEKQKSAVDHILRGGNHLLELIDRLLDLNKIESGKLSLEIKHIPARDVIDECLYLIQTRAKHEDIKILDQTVGEDLPLLWTDKTRLTQVLLNLLSNAAKYNRENGTVTLSCQQTPNQMLHISVADTGIGIPAKQRDDLFKPFERLGREAGQIEGTGIGLTISRQIIEQLGGEIGFESEEGKGSTFWVDVPLNSKQSSGSEENQGD